MPKPIMKSKQEMEEESNINAQTGIEDDNSSQIPDLPPVEDTAITFDDMEETSSVSTPPANTGEEVSVLQGISDQVAANVSRLQGNLDEARNDVKDANDAIGQFPEIRSNIEEDLNIRGLQEGVNDINSLIQSRQRGLQRRIESLESQPVAMGMIGRQQQASRTEAVRELADLSVIQMARQGQLEAANGVLDRKLEAEMFPLVQDLENSKFFYEQNKNLLSAEQNKQFKIKIAQDQRAYEKTKKTRERINGLILTAAQNGASPEDVKKISNSDNFGDAYAVAGKYINTEDEKYEFKTVGDVGYSFDPATGKVKRLTGGQGGGVYESNPAIRNKNPLNIKDPATGEFMTFATAEEGFQAAQRDLLIKMTGRSSREIPSTRQVVNGIALEGTGQKIDGNATLRDLIDVWAPRSDNNLNNDNYVQKVANDLGISPETRIGTLTGRVDELSKSMAEFEGWNPTTLSPIAQAVVDGTMDREDFRDMSQKYKDKVYEEIAASGREIDETGEFEKLSTTKNQLQNRLNRIDSMLANEKGLQLSSGAITGVFSPEAITARSLIPFGIGGVVDAFKGKDAKNDFLVDVKYVANNLIFEKLIELKDSGATFGALSEGELRKIGGAAEILAGMLNDDQTALAASEDKVREAINDLQTKWRNALESTEAEMGTMTEDVVIDQTDEQQADMVLSN